MQRIYSLLISFLFILVFTAPLSATQWRVTSSTDTGIGSLRNIIETAQTGDSIFFDIRGGIDLDSTLYIRKSLQIFGPGADSLYIGGQDRVRIMKVDTATVVYFDHLTFRDGNALQDSTDLFADGGVMRNFGKTRFENCLFIQNKGGYGGAISNSGGQGRNAELNLENCAFIQNYATPELPNSTLTPKSGGAIFSDGRFGGRSKVIAVNCTFSENEGTDRGGAIMHYQDESDTTYSIVLVHCTITQNKSNSGAGGVDVTQFGRTYYTNSIVSDNQGKIDNPNVFGNVTSLGGLLIGKITFNSSIGDNLLPGDLTNVDAKLGLLGNYDSAIPSHSLQCSSPAIDKGVTTPYGRDQNGRSRMGISDLGAFERNDAEDILIFRKDDQGVGSLRTAVINACNGDTLDLGNIVGSIYLESEIVLDKDLYIWGNPNEVVWLRAAAKNRHMVIDTTREVHIKNLSFAGGRPAQAGGGAILNKGRLFIEACTFTDNRAISGGAIANYGEGGKAVLKLLNSTFSKNEARILDGGAIDNYAFSDSAIVESNHCTFVNNEAEKRGGAVFCNPEAVFRVQNSILALNGASDGLEVYGNTQSLGHNLLMDNTEGKFSTTATDITGVDPNLSGLMYHGGGSYTHQLLAGSPAIDAAANMAVPAFDQRGYARVFGPGADIGAYEYDPATDLDEINASEIRVYPNPVKDFAYLLLPNSFARESSLDIDLYNIRSQLVRDFYSMPAAQTAEIKLDLRGLKAGVYFLVISNGKKHSHFKLILQ